MVVVIQKSLLTEKYLHLVTIAKDTGGILENIS